jgi:hypothetical protein
MYIYECVCVRARAGASCAGNAGRNKHTHTANVSFENLEEFKHFGPVNQEQIKSTEFLLLFTQNLLFSCLLKNAKD